MEWPKRARTVSWESGVLTLDGEKQFEVPELTAEIMDQLAGYALVGFHVKGYPVTDELLAPFAGHKSMVNFGVEDGALTDACFAVFSTVPKLRILLLTGNAGIVGSGLSALQGCKLDLLALDRTGLDDTGLLQAASIPKLSHIYLQSFAPDKDLQEFEERVCCVMENRMLVDVIDRALLRLKRYPDRGELYYEILTKQFIHRFNSTEKELLDELNMERSVFYDRKREAIFLLSLCLFGYAVPELQEELEMPRLYPD